MRMPAQEAGAFYDMDLSTRNPFFPLYLLVQVPYFIQAGFFSYMCALLWMMSICSR